MSQEWPGQEVTGQTTIPTNQPRRLPGGAVVFNLPPSPEQVAEEQRAAEAADRAARGEERANANLDRQTAAQTWTVLTPEESAAEGLPPGMTYQRNGLGEVKPVGGQASPRAAADNPDRVNQLRTTLDNIRDIRAKADDFLAVGTVGGNVRDLPVVGSWLGQNRADIEGALQMVEGDLIQQQLARLSQLNPQGVASLANSETEARRLASSVANLDPNQSLDQFLTGLTRAEDYYLRELARLEGGDAPGPSAMQSGGQQAPEVTGEGETYMTPEDLALQEELSAAVARGASPGELSDIAGRYGRTIPVNTLLEYQNRTPDRPVNVAVPPSGRRTVFEQTMGGVADTNAGAYFIGATNALLSGGMDELGAALGMDAATIQASKEALRERYPGASLAGEVSGQVLQSIPAMRAGAALGLGARGLGAVEVAQGAAYGAGESNDNRLGGAAMGAGGAIIGQQIARRIAEPAVQAALGRIADNAGVPREAVEQVLTAPATTEAAAQTSDAVAQGAAATGIDEQLMNLARKATNAVGGGRARRQLQEMVQADPEALAAAERLGIDLPADVYSANTQLRNLTGLARSQPGSQAEAAWADTLKRSAETVNSSLEALGATRDLADLSDEVFRRMDSGMAALERQGDELRQAVAANLDVRSPVDAANLREVLDETINDLGGIEAATAAMTSQEKALVRALGIGEEGASPPTYAYMERLRREIGDALNKNKGPWADTDEATLRRYYGALAEDRVAHVQAQLGDEAADQLRASNDAFSAMYAARQEMVDLFGKDLDRSLGRAFTQATNQASRGDATQIRRLMQRVPEELRGQVALSGILANSARRGGGETNFSFANFANTYRGLRENTPVYRELARAMTPEQDRFLTDLYAVSRRIADSESRVTRTGRALAQQFNAPGLMQRVLETGAGRVASVAGSAVGGSVAGPMGIAAASGGMEALIQRVATGGTRLDRVTNLIGSAPFREVIDRTTAGANPDAAINRLANSREFNRFARGLGLDSQEGRRAWIRAALTAAPTANAPEQPEAAPVMLEMAP